MEITVYNRTNQNIDAFEPYFRKIADRTCRVLRVRKDQTVSVTFMRSVSMHKINRDYRGIDRPTDVITFAAQDYEADFEMEEMDCDLGDIFINIDYARRQAKEYGHSYEREICFLFTHGLLHCLGYDHMTEEDEKIMSDLQKKILDPIIKRS